MFSGPIRPGTRGGQGDFTWSDVSADKDRENYLGHSINAPTGRWQKNKDVHWYNRDQEQAEADKREEIREIKQAEEDALAVALGFKPAPRPKGGEASTSGGSANPNAIPLPGESVYPDDRLKEEEAKTGRKHAKEERRARKSDRRAAREGKERSRSPHHPPHRLSRYREDEGARDPRYYDRDRQHSSRHNLDTSPRRRDPPDHRHRRYSSPSSAPRRDRDRGRESRGYIRRDNRSHSP